MIYFLCSPSWISSNVFHFLVGPKKQKFCIHSALAAQQSPALYALVNNGMKESRACGAYLPTVEIETFACFVEFVYTGDFKSPRAVEFDCEYQLEDRKTTGFDAPYPFYQSKLSLSTWDRFKTSLHYAYAGKQVYDTQYHGDLKEHHQLPSLLFLAKVYVLADCYGVDTLMKLSLHKLHQLMISSRSILDLVHLARFHADGSCPTRLSRLILEYFAFHLNFVRRSDGYGELIAEGPGLMIEAVDLFMALMAGEGLQDEPPVQEDEKSESESESEDGTL